jgi:hypothetical protein
MVALEWPDSRFDVFVHGRVADEPGIESEARANGSSLVPELREQVTGY